MALQYPLKVNSSIPTQGKQSKLFSLIIKALDNLAPIKYCRLTSGFFSEASQVFHEDAFLSCSCCTCCLCALPLLLCLKKKSQFSFKVHPNVTFLVKSSPVSLGSMNPPLPSPYYRGHCKVLCSSPFCIVIVLHRLRSLKTKIVLYVYLYSQFLAHNRSSIDICGTELRPNPFPHVSPSIILRPF